MTLSTVTIPPRPVLQPFVALLWATRAKGSNFGSLRERVLPTGFAHLVFRLGGTQQYLYSGEKDRSTYGVGQSFVGGSRAAPYDKAVSEDADTVGVLLRPGALAALTGIPGRQLAGVHTPLEDVWGRRKVAEVRDRLETASSLTDRTRVLEDVLAHELPRVRGMHPLIAHTLSRIEAGASVTDIVSAAGCSHRHLSRTFRDTVGFSPKRYSRVRRLGQALAMHRSGLGWADVAALAGYADQSHLHREFRALTGLTPRRYRQLASTSPWHVRLLGP